MTKQDFQSAPSLASSTDVLLAAHNLSCRRGATVLLSNLDFSLSAAKITTLLGSNGAGKSTLISTLAGDLKPDTGDVCYRGVPVANLSNRSWVFGVVSERYGLPKFNTVGQLIRYWSGVHRADAAWIRSLLAVLGVDSFMHRRVRKLSTGMRRRLELVLAFMNNPRIVILDEPFNGLDLDGVDAVRDLMLQAKQKGQAVLLTTHTFDEASRVSDEAWAIHRRSLVKLHHDKAVLGSLEASYRSLQEGGGQHA